MEDVIFSGTERRGQVGFAQVTLTLDNSDGVLPIEAAEIQVTRRYYRSGESEYFINKKLARLRDVNELFMDTGLGRDGYSIIGQGKIDAILSAKSTDRREIFEEAAGISRFRYRKEESERKLQRAEDDLLRVNDKISELELHVEPLRQQSEVAKKYLLLRDELRGLEISLWMSDLEDIAERITQFEQNALSAKSDVERARGELESAYDALSELAERMRQKDVESEKIRDLVSQTELSISREESDIAVLRANMAHARQDIERIKEELEKQKGQDSGIQAQIAERYDRIGSIESEISELDKKAEGLSERLQELYKTENNAENELLNIANLVKKVDDDLANEKNVLSSLETSEDELNARLKSLENDINTQRSTLDEAKDGAEKNIAELSVAKEKCESLENVTKGYEMKVGSAKAKFDKLLEEYRKNEMEISSMNSRIKMLEDMEKDYEGYSKAVKTVMREADRGTLQGVHGPAGELLNVPDKYSIAIETAMGAAMQNIIVATDNDGKNVINMLKRRDAGRVTCRPMSVIRGRRLNERKLLEEDGFEGIAFELVSFDPQYENIYMDLLGYTVVVDTLDSAVRIARRYNHRFRIVTLDGQVINAGGSMTGGSLSRNTGIISRANELQKLKAEAVEAKERLADVKNRGEESRRVLEASEYELQVASDELRTAQDMEVKLATEKSHYDILIQTLQSRVKQLENEVHEVDQRLKGVQGQRSAVEGKIKDFERQAEELEVRLEQASGGRNQLTEAKRSIELEESELRTQRASLEAELNTQRQAASELEKLRSELSGDTQSQIDAMERLKINCSKITAEIENKKKSADELRNVASGYRKRISDLSNERLSLEGDRTKMDKDTQEKNRELLSLERESGRLEQRIQAAQMEEKQIIDKLWDNYELSRSAAMEQRMHIEDISEAKRRTGELRRKMSSLGTPNLGAIEEFERVNSRYEYLTAQRDDIENSRRELLRIIGDITQEMKGIFQEEFQRINDSFKNTFLELFGGGRASLELEDPEDVLGCGIEIKVQPPGKTLKTITLLSGGEKAFVAIALYFAILKVRPTPFVVMDEIEAALDESNVIRVSKYVRRLADNTQFLIITHRRGTMEEADVLYGVTMQEQGVSKVLKMDLDEAEKTINKRSR